MRNALLLSLLLFAHSAVANPLRDAIAQGATSIAWKVKTDGVQTCCCREGQSWTNYGGRLEYSDILLIARVDGRRITKLRMVEPTCPLDAGVRFIADVPAETSLDFLLEQLRGSDDPEKFLAAIAMHQHPRVDPELIQLARHHQATDVRRQAIFWLGQHAGEKAAGELRRAVDEDPEDEVREHAVFAISQLPAERAVPMLVDLVKTHKRPKIRQRAMFWLAQTGDPRALDLIEEILLR